MARVYIAQAKCPNSHCILANAGEYEDDAAAKALGRELGKALDGLLAGKIIKRECAICGSDNIYIEIRRTDFATMAEAKPHLLELAARQQATRLYLNQIKANKN